MTRKEHLDFCKKRALEYVNRGDCMNGLTSMMSDLAKHPETTNHIGIALGLQLMMMGQLNTMAAARHFIEGFN